MTTPHDPSANTPDEDALFAFGDDPNSSPANDLEATVRRLQRAAGVDAPMTSSIPTDLKHQMWEDLMHTHAAPAVPAAHSTSRRAAVPSLRGIISAQAPHTGSTPHPHHSRLARAVARWQPAVSLAVVIAFLVGLIGIAYQRGVLDEPGAPPPQTGTNQTAPGTPTLREQAITCASPGYRPIVDGTGNSGTLASIGITNAPIVVDGDEIRIPTSTGEIVTLPASWTPLGGPLWSDTAIRDSEVIIRNIEDGQQWSFPAANGIFPGSGVYEAPYLIVPSASGKIDWRIIDITTGEERSISEIRGDPFPVEVEISRIGTELDRPSPSNGPSVWLFSAIELTGPGETQPPDLGPNALVLPHMLSDAAFLLDPANATYFHETAYDPATGRLAYPTANGSEGAIAIVEPESGARTVVRDWRFSTEARPLMFSADGSTLIVDQPNAVFSVSLSDEPSVIRTYEVERFVPIAHDTGSLTVLVMFVDRSLALVNAGSGEINMLPNVTNPQREHGPSVPMFRMSSDTPVYEIFDDETSTVRFIDLDTGTVSAETAVLNPQADITGTAIQPQFEYIIDYPHVSWAGSHAFLDADGSLQVISPGPGQDSYSIPPPDDFSVSANQVVDLRVSPGQGCFVLNVLEASNVTIVRRGVQTDNTNTWVASLEPGATWTRLDIGLTGWWEVYDVPAPAMRSATPIASPVATPG